MVLATQHQFLALLLSQCRAKAIRWGVVQMRTPDDPCQGDKAATTQHPDTQVFLMCTAKLRGKRPLLVHPYGMAGTQALPMCPHCTLQA